MTDQPPSSEPERRVQLQFNAASLGIDEAYISTLVDTFYTAVRANPQIGPVFENAIGTEWDHHLARMKDFWASIALSAGRYSGYPMVVHRQLADIQPWHFKVWLTLFEQTLRATAPNENVVDFFLTRAQAIGKRLQMGVFAPGSGRENAPTEPPQDDRSA
ncbi:MAG: group III truncated hemoglobin [Alphaproteobacteria bacterium]